MSTSFLSKRSQDAAQKLSDLRQLRDIAKSVDVFKQRRDQLAVEQNAFVRLIQQVRLLNSRGIVVVLPDLVYFLQKEFSNIQVSFEAQPDSLVQANLRIVFNQSAKCREELGIALLAAWEGYVDAQRLKLDEAILRVLSAVPDFRDAVADLRELDQQIATHRSNLPENQQDFETLHYNVGEMRRIWSELEGGGLPEDVLDFLRIVGNRSFGAPLDLLDKVRPWLKERGLEASFRVVITG